MPDSYTVVPDSLLEMSKALRDAHFDWDEMRTTLNRYVLGTFSFGVLGMLSGYPADYNTLRDEVVGRLVEGTESLGNTSRSLDKVAKHYADKEAEYYEQFGYLESEMD